jgi:hypothetical protein
MVRSLRWASTRANSFNNIFFRIFVKICNRYLFVYSCDIFASILFPRFWSTQTLKCKCWISVKKHNNHVQCFPQIRLILVLRKFCSFWMISLKICLQSLQTSFQQIFRFSESNQFPFTFPPRMLLSDIFLRCPTLDPSQFAHFSEVLSN